LGHRLKADWTCVSISGIWLSQRKSGEPLPTIYPRLTLAAKSVWHFAQMVPDAVVINLGTNDGGKPFDAEKYQKAWAPFVARIRKNYPKAHIFCTIGPMGQSKQMQDLIAQAVADINQAGDARVYAVKLPVQDEKIDGIGADWHPTVKCHQRMADTLAPIIAEKLNWKE
jgi:endoglucanase